MLDTYHEDIIHDIGKKMQLFCKHLISMELDSPLPQLILLLRCFRRLRIIGGKKYQISSATMGLSGE